MSEWKILPNEADSAMVNYAANFEWGAKTSWHGNTVEYIKEIYNKKTFRGCVDAGASYGFLSVPFSFMFEKVYSFEPNPGVVECLKENVASLSNVEVYSKALSNKNQTTYLEVNAKNATGMGSLRDKPTSSHNIVHQVEAITLDSLNLVDIDFFKIDVENKEWELIEGSIQTLERCKPVIYCEVHSSRGIEDYKRRRKIIGLFEDLGYVFHDVRYHDYVFLPL